ncbi:hypothetical protein KEM52_000688 [Ascosphaera acerosa]|nr:hypothetical protein KEM52_000688 [Ascosphaera acerosa]
MAPVTLSERLEALASPFKILYWGILCFVSTLYRALFVEKKYRNLQAIREKAFTKLWCEYISPDPAATAASSNPDGSVAPATELKGSASLFPPLLSLAKGVVLDLGPGNGAQIKYFTNSDVKVIYGAEPCVPMHAELQRTIDAAPVAGRYHIIDAAAEPRSLFKQLRKYDLMPKGATAPVFDTICCMRCLCSVDDPDKVVAGLYTLLKPGGQLLVVEHVINAWQTPSGNALARMVQVVCQNLGFPFFVGGCHLNRDITKIVDYAALGDGGWARADHELLWGHSPFPYLSAVFTKRDTEKISS